LITEILRRTRKPAPENTEAKAILRQLQDPRAYGRMRWQEFLRSGFVPQVFYDIGANDPFVYDGQQSIFKPLMPDTRFYLVEAMAKHEPQLLASEEPYAIAVLGEEDGTAKTFYESHAYVPGHGDSYYLERTPVYSGERLIRSEHTTRRLDSLAEERGWPLPDFIKLDTQGSELDILRGAPRCLAHARGLQIECNILDYNEGAPLLPEVIGFMDAAGFRPYDITQLHFNRSGQLLQLDMLFLRSGLLKDAGP
jgi:FkbM family methyltransferase